MSPPTWGDRPTYACPSCGPHAKTAGTGAARSLSAAMLPLGMWTVWARAWNTRLVSRSFAREIPEVEALDVHPQAIPVPADAFHEHLRLRHDFLTGVASLLLTGSALDAGN